MLIISVKLYVADHWNVLHWGNDDAIYNRQVSEWCRLIKTISFTFPCPMTYKMRSVRMAQVNYLVKIPLKLHISANCDFCLGSLLLISKCLLRTENICLSAALHACTHAKQILEKETTIPVAKSLPGMLKYCFFAILGYILQVQESQFITKVSSKK